jgi:O-antigen ligase
MYCLFGKSLDEERDQYLMRFSDTIEILFRRGIKAAIYVIPFLALYVSPSLDFPFITGKNFAFRIIIAFAAIFWLGLCCFSKEYRLRNSRLTLFLLIFIFIAGLADLLGVNPYKSFWSNYERMEGYITLLHLTLYFMIVKSVLRSERDWKVLFTIFVIVASLVSLIAFVLPDSSVLSPEFGDEYRSRLYSTIGSPPFLASYLLLAVFFGLILFFAAHKKNFRYLYFLPITLNLVVIYFSRSRGALVAAGISLLLGSVVFFFHKMKNADYLRIRKTGVACLIIAGIMLLVILLFADGDFIKQDRTLSRFTSLQADQALKTRLTAWKMAWNGIKERPILGWGQENFIGIYTVNQLPVFNGHVMVDRAHNILIDWLVNAGFLGMLSYLMVLGYAMYAAWSSYKVRKRITRPVFITLFTALAVYFIQNLVTFDTINTYMLFFALLAYIDYLDKGNSASVSRAKFDVINKRITRKSLGVVIFALLLVAILAYHINYRPIQVSRLSVRISNNFPRYTSFVKLKDDFIGLLSYGTFGMSDIRRKMLSASTQIIKYKLFAFEGSFDFINKTIEELEKDFILNRYNLDYLSQMVRFYYEVARYEPSFADEAEKLIRKFLRINPDFEALYFRLADVHLLKHEYEKALAIIERTVKRDPQNVRKQLRLAEVAILASRDTVVSRALEQVKKIRMTEDSDIASGRKPVFSARELFLIARNYIEAVEYAKALDIYKKILIISPDDPRYRLEAAKLYLKLGDLARAGKEARKAVELDPLNYTDEANNIINSLQ